MAASLGQWRGSGAGPVGWLTGRWRRSLALRVVVVTSVIGLVMSLAIGSYLYHEIAVGLVRDATNVATAQALRSQREAQSQFDHTNKNQTIGEVQQFAQQVVQNLVTGEGSPYVGLYRSVGNTTQPQLSELSSASLSLSDIPTDLRAAVALHFDHQQTEIISLTDPTTGDQVGAVAVGQQMSLPIVGEYSLFLIYPMTREQDTLDLVSRTFSLGGVLILLLVGVTAWAVTRMVVVPVRAAAGVASQFSEGHFEERMPIRGDDDLARLGTSFNEMATSIQQQIARLEELSTFQQQFVSDVSHELRTPVTTIRMAADVLHDARAGFPPAVSRSAELLHTELDRFEGLLTDLLEISRYDAGAAVIDAEPTDLCGLVERVVESTRPLAERRGSALTVLSEEDSCIAEIDPRRIERVLRNLVVNAVEHGEGKPIIVTVGANDSAAAVTVRDHGVGLAPGESSKVFNRFWRADRSRTRTTGGTGLGLAISLQDARLHRGWLQAWGAPGQGSCFRLTVPRSSTGTIDGSPLPLVPSAQVGAPASLLAGTSTTILAVPVPAKPAGRPEGGAS